MGPFTSYFTILAFTISVAAAQTTTSDNGESSTSIMTSSIASTSSGSITTSILASSSSKSVTTRDLSQSSTIKNLNSTSLLTPTPIVTSISSSTFQNSSSTATSVPFAYVMSESCTGGSSCTNQTITVPLGRNITFSNKFASSLFVRNAASNSRAVVCTFAAGKEMVQHKLTSKKHVDLSTNVVSIDWIECVASNDCSEACITSSTANSTKSTSGMTPSASTILSTASTSVTSSASASHTGNHTNNAMGVRIQKGLLPVALVGVGMTYLL